MVLKFKIIILLVFKISYAASPMMCLQFKETKAKLSQVVQAKALNVGSDSILYVSQTKGETRSASLVISMIPNGIPLDELKKTPLNKIWLQEQNERFVEMGFSNVEVSAAGFQNFGRNKIFSYFFSYIDRSANKISGKSGLVFDDKRGILKFDFRADISQFSQESKWVNQILEQIVWDCGK